MLVVDFEEAFNPSEEKKKQWAEFIIQYQKDATKRKDCVRCKNTYWEYWNNHGHEDYTTHCIFSKECVDFDNGKKLQLKAIGLHGLFRGYLTFVRGNFEFVDLQDINYMSSRIFALDDDICLNVGESTKKAEQKDDKKKKKDKKNEVVNNNENSPIAILSSCIPDDWDEEKPGKYITLITNFRPEILSLSLDNDKDFFKYQNVRCVLYFPNSDEQMDTDEKKN